MFKGGYQGKGEGKTVPREPAGRTKKGEELAPVWSASRVTHKHNWESKNGKGGGGLTRGKRKREFEKHNLF